MPFPAKCPNCKANFRLADELAGKKVRCQKCKELFKAANTDPKAASDEDAPPVLKAAPDTAISPKPIPAVKAAPDDTADDDGKRNTSRKPPPVSSKEPPRRRPATKARRERQSSSGGGMMALVFLLLGGGLLGCLGCTCGVGWYMYSNERPVPKPGPGPIAGGDKVPGDGNKDRVIDIKRDGKVDGNKDFVKPPPPPPPNGINVVFGPEGIFTSNNFLAPTDPVNQFGRPYKLYTVAMTAGQQYQIDQSSNVIDSYLYLFDDLNQLVAQDDDGGGNLNARISYKAQRTGVHRIHASHLIRFGNFTLTVRQIGGVVVKKPPDPPAGEIGKSYLTQTLKAGGFSAKDFSLSVTGLTTINATEPVWDAQGQSFYWLDLAGKVSRIGRDGKVQAFVDVGHPCHHLALSSEGLVTIAAKFPGELVLMDAGTLAVRSRIACSSNRWIGATPKSSRAVVAGAAELTLVDLKTEKVTNLPPLDGLNVVAAKNMGLSPDAKYLMVQASNYMVHRLRIEGDQLSAAGTRPAVANAMMTFQFSPDGKRLAMTYPLLSPVSSKKVKALEVVAPDDWDKTAFTLPGYFRQAAFDAQGGLFATFDKELRYYPNPATQSDRFEVLTQAGIPLPRRLWTVPEGTSCLGAALGQTWLFEK